MSQDRETLAQRIEELVKKSGKSPRAISMEATGKPDTVRDVLRGKSLPSSTTLAKLAAVLGTTTDFLLGSAKTPAPVLSEVALSEHHLSWGGPEPEEPGVPLVGTGDCADLEVKTQDGQEVLIERSSFDPEYHIQFVHRPPALRGNSQAYAVYFHGSSMEPRYFAGEVGLVDPTRPAGPGDFVVVQLNDGNGHGNDVVSVLVKRLVRANSRELVLEQYNPPLTFAVERAHVARFHRIIPPTEQLL